MFDIETVNTEDPNTFWDYVKQLGSNIRKDIPEEIVVDNGEICVDINTVPDKWKYDYEAMYRKSNAFSYDLDIYNDIMHRESVCEGNINHTTQCVFELDKDITLDEVKNAINGIKLKKTCWI